MPIEQPELPGIYELEELKRRRKQAQLSMGLAQLAALAANAGGSTNIGPMMSRLNQERRGRLDMNEQAARDELVRQQTQKWQSGRDTANVINTHLGGAIAEGPEAASALAGGSPITAGMDFSGFPGQEEVSTRALQDYAAKAGIERTAEAGDIGGAMKVANTPRGTPSMTSDEIITQAKAHKESKHRFDVTHERLTDAQQQQAEQFAESMIQDYFKMLVHVDQARLNRDMSEKLAGMRASGNPLDLVIAQLVAQSLNINFGADLTDDEQVEDTQGSEPGAGKYSKATEALPKR